MIRRNKRHPFYNIDYLSMYPHHIIWETIRYSNRPKFFPIRYGFAQVEMFICAPNLKLFRRCDYIWGGVAVAQVATAGAL